MDPRTYHKRVQSEQQNRQHRAALLQRLGISHLSDTLFPADDGYDVPPSRLHVGQASAASIGITNNSNAVEDSEKEVHDDAYDERKAAGAGATSVQKPKRRPPTVLSAHLSETHAQVRQFYELLSAWLVPAASCPSATASTTSVGGGISSGPASRRSSEADSTCEQVTFAPENGLGAHSGRGSVSGREGGRPKTTPSGTAGRGTAGAMGHKAPFSFGVEWLRTILGKEVVVGLSEPEAQQVLKAQINKSARTAAQEAVMCDTNDYGALRESVLAYLGMTFFAIQSAVTNCGNGEADSRPNSAHYSTTFLTNPHDYCVGTSDSGAGGIAGDNCHDQQRKGTLTGPSKKGKSQIIERETTEEAARALQLRLAKRMAEKEQEAGAIKLPPPPIIDMRIARAVCRPQSGGASVAGGPSSSTVPTILSRLAGGNAILDAVEAIQSTNSEGAVEASAGGSGTGLSPRDRGTATALEQTRKAKTVRDNIIPILTLAAQLNEEEKEGDGHDVMRSLAGRGSKASSGENVFENRVASSLPVGDPDEIHFSRAPAGSSSLRSISPRKAPDTSTRADDLTKLRFGSAGPASSRSVRLGSAPSAGARRHSSPSAPESGRSYRPPTAPCTAAPFSRRPKPPTGTVEVASAHIRVTNTSSGRKNDKREDAIDAYAMATANGVVILPTDTHKRQQYDHVSPSVHAHNNVDDGLVLVSSHPAGASSSGSSLIAGEWGVGTSTWSPRNDLKWISKELRPVSMRHGRR